MNVSTHNSQNKCSVFWYKSIWIEFVWRVVFISMFKAWIVSMIYILGKNELFND